MPLRGTIESVYKGTLVYAREHNPTVGGIYEDEGGAMQMFSGEHLIVDDSQINQSCGVEIIVFVDEKEEVVVGNESFWV